MTPLVLLPGMMCDARLFAPQITTLSGRIPVMTMPVAGCDTMAGLAGDILACAPPRFALAGLSMGGILAMELVRQAPERVARLALLDTNPLAEVEEVKARRGPQIEAVRAGGLDAVMRDVMIPNYLHDATDPKGIAALCLEMARDLGPGVFAAQSKALRDRRDQTETLRAYSGPALVLCGRHDRLCPLSRHHLLHDLMPQSTFEIIEGAGHLPTLEQPETTTAALVRWLEDAA
ncbi:alpha/beta fold hydrolase [Stappia indica]|uniref:alpha/beta fold hydrolase n=1 Tax=Stappia indica TaxID=538381 RepID=UPI001CD24BFF|nr:alpha/beta fold hydrolase [Stappia indica]MCA1296874.1 alpha/beta hydrolase [Stappia indica]